MVRKATRKSPLRLLLNAEPFGFGPTAAIAGFFPHLRPHFDTIGYMGKKHTLDLQKVLPYDAIHDVTHTAKEDRAEDYAPIFAQYDILFTAMDHKIAEEAQKAGLKVFYYDALAWYWPQIPESVQNSDLYIAQNFFGVEERLKTVFARHAAAHPVPPIAPDAGPVQDKEHILINMGGLQNPYWPIEDVIDYARSVIGALRKAIPESEKIVIAGSQAVADALKDEGVITYPRKDMEDILARSKVAFMTPGLGNIYDAAAYNIPTVWLPPANDSQGQQLDLIAQHKMCDAVLGWADIVPGASINFSAEQPAVLAQIAATASQLAHNKDAQARLLQQARACFETASNQQGSKTNNIVARFGKGGEEDVARLVVAQARRYCYG
ncbi:MAG: hypothetical protein KKA05_00715 [Alphaproteobacteria bacterium]|nr:hypothetical protein [Alphaproteobacteria bacterium]MBU0859029.1 hypothetical protein [Alphaproteobacteria bacterium]